MNLLKMMIPMIKRNTMAKAALLSASWMRWAFQSNKKYTPAVRTLKTRMNMSQDTIFRLKRVFSPMLIYYQFSSLGRADLPTEMLLPFPKK
jgi:1,4-dihydroxy-2-naphthoyl-CoA synthase